MNKAILAVALLAVMAGCSSKTKEETKRTSTVSMEAKQIAAEQDTSYVTEFGFAKGSSNLSSTAQKDIQHVVSEAQRNGKIQEVKVITWGDSEYPSVHTKKLSKEEVNLVKERNKKVEDYIKKNYDASKVKTYSMAERPNSIQEIFGTSDAKVKKSLETAGIPTTDTSVKIPSKASKSIVIVILE